MMAMQIHEQKSSLAYLLQDMASEAVLDDTTIGALCIDSREIKKGDLFIAMPGTHTHGSKYIEDAVNRGAVAVVTENTLNIRVDQFPIPVYGVTDLRSNLGLLASRFYDYPSKDLAITGITGTNGKTSVAYYLAQAMSSRGQHVGSIGTLGCGIFGNLKSSANTTPDAITINRLLNEFRSGQIKNVVMEVSSHGLEQGRVNHILFNTAVFTNLSRDHLDYHGGMDLYGESKKKLFDSPGLKNAVINIDDEFGKKLVSEINPDVNILGYGICDSGDSPSTSQPELSAGIIEQDIDILRLDISGPWGRGELTAPLPGDFNAYNLLACLGVLCLNGMGFDEALDRLSAIKGVPGRMEYFGNVNTAKIFVDYSHTPDALMHALFTLRKLCKGKLVCVFGCGGDRDQGKRPEMGRVAEQYADKIILTNDNPRTESPERILEDIRSGMSATANLEIRPDRSTAILEAFRSSSVDDCILIAGKGHETYQEIGSVKLPYSDRQLVRNLLGKHS